LRRYLRGPLGARHDSLTGLPNSAELRTRLAGRLCSQPQDAAASDHVDAYSYGYGYGPDEMAAPLAGRDHHTHAVSPESSAGGDSGGKGLAVLFCDLDGFKLINDRHGHHTGDAVLIEVARRLSSVVRDGDTVARLGGDEFVVLADGLARDDAADLADRLLNAIIPPIRVDGRSVKVGASFGIGWAGCGMTADEVLKSADQRMYVEKRSRSAGRPRNEDDGSDRRGEGGPDSRSGKRPDNRPENRNSNGNRSHRRAG
jgi:diguanylate cyclase (GGDEF)-like protein